MNTRTAAAVLAVGFLAGLVQLAGALVSSPLAIAAAVAVVLICLMALKFLQLEIGPAGSVLLPALSSAAGVGCLAFVPDRQSPYLWTAPLAACALSLAVLLIRERSSERCGLCQRRLGGGVAFSCPRCPLRVCDSCWVFEYRRCRLCEQNHVPIFIEPKWWDRELGPRLTFGRCQLCQTPVEAGDVDLRACRNCGRPQCRDCWDASNGECQRCRWVAGNLPESLRPYMTSSSPPADRRAARSAR